MDVANIVTSMPPLLLFVLVVASGMLRSRSGTWLSGKRYEKGLKEPTTSTSTVVGAITEYYFYPIQGSLIISIATDC